MANKKESQIDASVQELVSDLRRRNAEYEAAHNLPPRPESDYEALAQKLAKKLRQIAHLPARRG